MMLQDVAGNFFVGDVALRLARPDRHRPAILLGHDGFPIPVRTFDQPQGNGQIFLFRPGNKIRNILFAALEIGLKHKAKMRIGAELRGRAQAFEELNGHFLIFELFHIDAHEPAHIDDLLVQRDYAPVDTGNGIFLRYGLGLGIQRGMA